MTLKRTAELQRKTPMKRSGFLRSNAREQKAVARIANGLKSRGMKGRAPTAEEQRFMDAIASIGCIACLKDGNVNPWISIHHIDGRTKPGAHFLVLGLCAGHHQQGTGEDKSLIAVHPDKARFERRYGTQMELLAGAVAQVQNQLFNPDGSEIQLPEEITAMLVAETEQEAA